jgi:hypothetical protein
MLFAQPTMRSCLKSRLDDTWLTKSLKESPFHVVLPFNCARQGDQDCFSNNLVAPFSAMRPYIPECLSLPHMNVNRVSFSIHKLKIYMACFNHCAHTGFALSLTPWLHSVGCHIITISGLRNI